MDDTRVEYSHYGPSQVRTRTLYDKDGKFHGICEGWHENGQKSFEATWEHGKWNGPCIDWDEYGVCMATEYAIRYKKVSEAEWREYELIRRLAGI